ncbi:MAG: hypothetical protein KDD62_06690, partial [Bdellovibrionales bacterium]|nr:hypothetical protein [Bdellovibrionales bacterium]
EPVVAASTLGASLFEAERGPQEKERLIQDAPETLEAAPRPIKEAEGKLEPSERLSVKKRIVQHKEVSSPKPTRESKPRVRPQSRGLGNPDVVNVFDAISKVGHDIDFTPERYEGDFEPTDAPAGSQEKIEILRQRIDKGMPLWHPDDRKDYEGLRGAVHPRNG